MMAGSGWLRMTPSCCGGPATQRAEQPAATPEAVSKSAPLLHHQVQQV